MANSSKKTLKKVDFQNNIWLKFSVGIALIIFFLLLWPFFYISILKVMDMLFCLKKNTVDDSFKILSALTSSAALLLALIMNEQQYKFMRLAYIKNVEQDILELISKLSKLKEYDYDRKKDLILDVIVDKISLIPAGESKKQFINRLLMVYLINNTNISDDLKCKIMEESNELC